MLRTFRGCLVFAAAIFVWGCTDLSQDVDFREQWIGTYEGTKSSISFEDTMFTTPVSFDVTIDVDSTNGLIVNRINFPVTEEGSFGPDFLGNGPTRYELTIEGDELKLASTFISTNAGPPFRCFIIVTKI